MFDVVIIGAGIIGSAIAQYLSRFDLNVLVIEACEEVSSVTSKANSGIIHAGFDAEPGSLKACFNVLGNSMFERLSKDLDIPFKRNGSLVLCFSEGDMPRLQKLYDQGIKNNVPDIKILSKEEIKKLEPNINDKVFKALYAPTGGIISPYEATVAFAENAFSNGVCFWLGCKALNISKETDHYIINTSTRGSVNTKFIVNAAGLYSDEINNLIAEKKYQIYPRRGEYVLTDKIDGVLINKTLFQLPTERGKGVLVTPTVHGNLLIGPSSEDIEDKTDFDTVQDILNTVVEVAAESINFPISNVIASFSGLRSNIINHDDFVVGKVDGENFINALGINSPGLSSAPAIAKYISNIIVDVLQPTENKDFTPYRVSIKKFNELSLKEQNELIAKNNAYGQIVCRCETITEGEIIEAIKRPLGARTIDGIKRRTRAGMGRCQGGFCTSRIMEIMCKELNISPSDVTKFGKGSNLIVNHIKDEL